MGNPIPSFNSPAASMGFIGYLKFFGVQGASQLVRATSSSLKLTQAIDAPDIIDGRYDRTIYQLQPFEAGGSIEFPAIYGVKDNNTTCSYSPAGGLLSMAVCRAASTGLLRPFDTLVKYSNGTSSFMYKNCIINTYKISVDQKSKVDIAYDLIATHRDAPFEADAPGPNDTPVTRVVTWNDTYVQLSRGGTTGDPLDGRWVRHFEVTFNNNAERYYTLNGSLYAQAIAPRKRDITGNVKLMGRDSALSDWAFTNQNRCKETQTVTFGYNVSDTVNCCGEFKIVLPNVVYRIEDLQLQNDLFETTVEWRSLPSTQAQLTTGWLGIPSCL